MLILNRILSRRLLSVLLAGRTFRKNQKRSGKMDELALLVALVVGVRTWRAGKAEQRREGSKRRFTLEEAFSDDRR